MARFFVPADNPQDWQALLGDPVKHWRTGFSAKSLAYSWTEARGFPEEIARVVSRSPYDAFSGLEILFGVPEHQVPLPGGSRPSQNDIFVLAKGAVGLVSIAVEGKVSEPFDVTVAEWISNPTRGREARLDYLCDTIGVERAAVSDIRYQLLHRTASSIIEARRFCSGYALMLVHSFSQTHEWFDDYRDFVRLYGIEAQLNQIHEVARLDGTHLYLGWVVGNPEYLER